MNCPRCSDPVKEEWNYCPKCGARIKPVLLNKVLPNIRVRVIKTPGMNTLMRTPSSSLEVIEPVTRKEKGVLIIEFPGVKTAQSISLRKVKDSLEVNAYTQDKRYFKIINLEGKSVKNHSFKDEELRLVIE
ncbi:MAG: hypothetical protein JW791_01950 [Nanoarchaeota archaeon]|nr:hypothetical protein [Nanoarchaeota archaeon]